MRTQLRKREQTNSNKKSLSRAGWSTGGMWRCVVEDTLLYVSQQGHNAGRCDRPGHRVCGMEVNTVFAESLMARGIAPTLDLLR